jgi:hypothetical protein
VPNPRDKAYSILALTDYNIRVASQPDYSKPVKWVYANVVKTHIEVYRDLSIIARSMGRSTKGHPSWCPDWDTPIWRILGGFLSQLHAACDARPAIAGFLMELPGMWVTGKLDYVCCDQAEFSDGPSSQRVFKDQRFCKSDLRLITESFLKSEITIGGKDPEDRHTADIVAGQEESIYRRSILGALASTFVAGNYKISGGFDDRPTWESAK